MISKACVVGTYQRKLEEIAHLGVDLLVIVPPYWIESSGKIPLERAYLEGYRMAVEPLRFNGKFHWNYFPTLGQHIRAFRPDIVHIDEEPYNLAAWHALRLSRRAGARALFFSWQNIRRRYPPPFSLGEAWTLRKVDYAIMGTQSAAEVWQAKGYRGPFAVIPQFGVDPDIFHPAESPAAPHEPVIGFIGRLVPEKGVDLLIRAVSRLKQAGQAPRLNIVGQGPERESLEALARDLGLADRVHFVGQLPSTQLPALYPQLDVVAVPSRTLPNWKEQFGRVIVEAMACGVPVIGSNSGAIPDVIGDAGLIFPEDDSAALAERLRAALENQPLRAQLIERGRARILESFTHARIAAQTVDVYRTMLN
jgi:glycosyltransferase involved in cell wall biosynthesis